MPLRDRVIEAMRSGEWLRTQWIVRVVYDLGATPVKDISGWAQMVVKVRETLRGLEADGQIEHRDATEEKPYGPIPRSEWRKSA